MYLLCYFRRDCDSAADTHLLFPYLEYLMYSSFKFWSQVLFKYCSAEESRRKIEGELEPVCPPTFYLQVP